MQCAQFPDSETREKGVKEEGKCLRDVPLKVTVHIFSLLTVETTAIS